jgi:CDGSH-type Zn-finger protein
MLSLVGCAIPVANLAARRIDMSVKITVRPNGPYLVEGEVELHDPAGNKIDTSSRPKIALCRCGGSVTKPFCDGTHSKIGFQAAEAAVAQEKN